MISLFLLSRDTARRGNGVLSLSRKNGFGVEKMVMVDIVLITDKPAGQGQSLVRPAYFYDAFFDSGGKYDNKNEEAFKRKQKSKKAKLFSL